MLDQPQPRPKRRVWAAIGAAVATVAIQIVESGVLNAVLIDAIGRWLG